MLAKKKPGPHKKLEMACRRGEVEVILASLAAGADPNTYADAFLMPCVAQAMERIEDADQRARVAQAFVEAGVDLLAFAHDADDGGQPNSLARTSAAWEHAAVRHEPVLAKVLAQRIARGDVLAHTPLEQRDRRRWEKRIWEQYAKLDDPRDTPWRQRLRELLRNEAGREAFASNQGWWQQALMQRSPCFVHDLIEESGPRSPAGMLSTFTQPDGWVLPYGCGPAVCAWLAALTPAQRLDALLGCKPPTPGQRRAAGGRGPGLLAAVAHSACQGDACAQIWALAREEPAVWKTMAAEETLAAYALLVTRYLRRDNNRHQKIVETLKVCQAHGLDLASVCWGDLEAIALWKNPNRVSLSSDKEREKWVHPENTLLDSHLLQDSSQNVSVGNCQWLIQQGIQPTSHSLGLLCAQMTYSTVARRLEPLFRKWVQKHGLNPNDPAAPAINYATTGTGRRLVEPLLTWAAAERLRDALPAPPVLAPRPRF